MACSRKHYIAVADAIKVQIKYCFIDCQKSGLEEQRFNEGKRESAREIALHLASIFAADNSAFDRSRFLVACGVQS